MADETSGSNAAPRAGLTLLLAGLSMFGPFSIDTMFPAFPEIAHEFGVSALTMQQTLSVYLLAYAFMSLFHGTLSDSFGRRVVVLSGIGVFVLGSIGCALATSFSALLLWRVVQGLSAGAGHIVGRAIIRDLYTGPAVQRTMAAISMLFTLAPAVAPIIGGWVLLVGTWRWIFWFLVLWAGLLLALCAWRLPETHAPERRLRFALSPLLTSYATMFRDAHFWPLAIASTVNFSALFLYIASAPAYVMGLLKLGPQQMAWLFVPVVSGMFLGALISRRLAGVASADRTVSAGYYVMLAACALNVAVSFVLVEPRVPWSVLPIGLHAIGISLSFPTLTLLLLDRFPSYRGGVSSLQAFVSLVFNALLAGVIVVHLSDDARKLAVGAALLTLSGFIAWRVYRGRAQRELAHERAAGPEAAVEEAEPF
jgi:DHA1 family bicyclomycin/chloramphenicol resistance-like MFS transporter